MTTKTDEESDMQVQLEEAYKKWEEDQFADFYKEMKYREYLREEVEND